jgi:hypothetical protein
MISSKYSTCQELTRWKFGSRPSACNFFMNWVLKTSKTTRMLIPYRGRCNRAKESYGSMDRASDLDKIHHAWGDAGSIARRRAAGTIADRGLPLAR